MTIDDVLETLSAEELIDLITNITDLAVKQASAHIEKLIDEGGAEQFRDPVRLQEFREESVRATTAVSPDRILQWLKDHGHVAPDWVPDIDLK